MLRFARRLTSRPASIDRPTVDSLKEAGFSDLDVLQLVEVVGYYAYANRIANGLGVTLETD